MVEEIPPQAQRRTVFIRQNDALMLTNVDRVEDDDLATILLLVVLPFTDHLGSQLLDVFFRRLFVPSAVICWHHAVDLATHVL